MRRLRRIPRIAARTGQRRVCSPPHLLICYPPSMSTYSWRLLRAGRLKLDGGSMFGLVPRVVWMRSVPPDDRGRITVHHNCLLLERSGPAEPGPDGESARFAPRLILIETGSGDKMDTKSREIFDLEDRSILDA